MYGPDYVPCAWCGCLRPERSLEWNLSGGPICTDWKGCVRSKRIREEVSEEFERLTPHTPFQESVEYHYRRKLLKNHSQKLLMRARPKPKPITTLQTVQCSTCGGDFEAKVSKDAPRKFCTKRCQEKAAKLRYRAKKRSERNEQERA